MTDAASYLTNKDKDLKRILELYGEPPPWRREGGFATLIHIILEQQVSLASALNAFTALNQLVDTLTPANFLTLSDEQLKTAGFSRQKTRYGRALAEAVLANKLDLAGLESLPDDAVRAELTKIVGIGSWTANIYLLMVLRRPDIFPAGDLALVVAVKEIKGLATRPSADKLTSIAKDWQPHRSYAARLLWHYYLSR